jgi:hypothetical protein
LADHGAWSRAEDDENVCAICTEPLTEGGDVLRLPCNDKHVFHLACMRQVGFYFFCIFFFLPFVQLFSD